ncbi:MAG TPA: hypothetical protein VET26_00745 [Candidatus Sulfotelmatobacter sp.]|nr:hypothetical protein [Candidatus Sulfotelmatobacter sp.]
MQLEKDWIESAAASDMADALGLDTDTLIGKVARVWAWSLDNAAPKGFVGGLNPTRAVEEAAHWTGKRGAFVKAAIRYGGILKQVEDRFLFRGWEKRYGAILEKAAKWAEVKRNQRKTKDVHQDVSLDVQQDRQQDGKRSDQDQDLKEDLPPPPTPSAEQPVVVVEDQSGRNHDCTTATGFWAAVSVLRTENRLPRELEPPSWSAWYARAAGDVGPELLLEAYVAFRRDEHFRDRGWPTAIFMSDGVWRPRARPSAQEARRL